MAEYKQFNWRTLFIWTAVALVMVFAFLVEALSGFDSVPVEYTEPPDWVRFEEPQFEESARFDEIPTVQESPERPIAEPAVVDTSVSHL